MGLRVLIVLGGILCWCVSTAGENVRPATQGTEITPATTGIVKVRGARPTRVECGRAFDHLGSLAALADDATREGFVSDCWEQASKAQTDCVIAAENQTAVHDCLR